ncbi:ComEC/Rec2 family competence protein [Rothia koreensis]|uniref:ComEC/Rec2 family competence protein n=1 Tax=Rothia koreensis TaxID=592378 RepID=UPI003FCCEBB9
MRPGGVLDLRLLPAAAASWCTAAWVGVTGSGHQFPVVVMFWILGAAGAGAAALTASRGWARAQVLSGCLAAMSTMCVAAGSVLWFALPPASDLHRALRVAAEGTTTARLDLVVEPDRRARAVRYNHAPGVNARVVAIESGGERASGSVRVTTWWPTSARSGGEGAPHANRDTARFGAGHVQEAMGGPQPGTYQVTAVPLRHDAGPPDLRIVSAQLTSPAGNDSRTRPDQWWRARMRDTMSARTSRLLTPDTAALVTGMAYGDDSALSAGAKEALRTAGLTHLTAVSGSNVALVFLLGVQSLRWTRCPRAVTLAVGGVVVGGYAALVGPEPSVLRATSMGLLSGTAMVLGRGRTASATLWFSIIALLCADASMAGNVGFILSALATAGILLQGPSAQRILSVVLPEIVADVVAMTIVATLWCTPVLLWVSGFWSGYSVAANVAVAPVVPVATVCAIVGILATPLPLVADATTMCAGWGAGWIESVAEVVARWPGARIPALGGLAPVAIATLLSTVSALIIVRLDPARSHSMETIRAADSPQMCDRSVRFAPPFLSSGDASATSPKQS